MPDLLSQDQTWATMATEIIIITYNLIYIYCPFVIFGNYDSVPMPSSLFSLNLHLAEYDLAGTVFSKLTPYTHTSLPPSPPNIKLRNLVPSARYQKLGTKYLVPSSWYPILGTKYWYQDKTRKLNHISPNTDSLETFPAWLVLQFMYDSQVTKQHTIVFYVWFTHMCRHRFGERHTSTVPCNQHYKCADMPLVVATFICLVPSTWYRVLGTRYLVPRIWYHVFGTKRQVLSTQFLFNTKCLAPCTWYHVLGTKYLVPSCWYEILGTKYSIWGIWYRVLGTKVLDFVQSERPQTIVVGVICVTNAFIYIYI